LSAKPKQVLDYEGILIGSVERTSTSETRVYLRESRKGNKYIEIRRWIHLERYDGPDKKGIGIYPREAKGVIELIEKALEEVEKGKGVEGEVSAPFEGGV